MWFDPENLRHDLVRDARRELLPIAAGMAFEDPLVDALAALSITEFADELKMRRLQPSFGRAHDSSFAAVIAAARNLRGLSVESLARASEVDPSAIRRLEKNATEVPLQIFVRLAAHVGLEATVVHDTADCLRLPVGMWKDLECVAQRLGVGRAFELPGQEDRPFFRMERLGEALFRVAGRYLEWPELSYQLVREMTSPPNPRVAWSLQALRDESGLFTVEWCDGAWRRRARIVKVRKNASNMLKLTLLRRGTQLRRDVAMLLPTAAGEPAPIEALRAAPASSPESVLPFASTKRTVQKGGPEEAGPRPGSNMRAASVRADTAGGHCERRDAVPDPDAARREPPLASAQTYELRRRLRQAARRAALVELRARRELPLNLLPELLACDWTRALLGELTVGELLSGTLRAEGPPEEPAPTLNT